MGTLKEIQDFFNFLLDIISSRRKFLAFLAFGCLFISVILICWAVGIKIFPEYLVLPDISSNLWRVIVLLVALIFAVLGGLMIRRLLPPPVPTLKVFTGLSDEESQVFKEIVAKFREGKVKVENIHSGLVPNRLKKKKSSADLIAIDVNGPMHELVRKGLIEDLSETISNCQGLLPSSVHPALKKHLEVNGKRYFMPLRPNVQIVFFNKEKFANIERPKTWEEVREVAKRFYDQDGEARVAIQAQDDVIHITLFQLISAAGGDPFNLLDPHSKEALEFLRTLLPYVWPTSSEINWQSAKGYLRSNYIYLLRNWSFTVGLLYNKGEDKNYDNFKSYSGWSWEKDSKPVNLLGGDLLALPKNARHKEVAKELMRFLMSEDVQKIFVDKLTWPPMRTDIGIPDWQKDHQSTMEEAIHYAEPLPENWLPHMPDIYKETFNKIVKLDPEGDIESILKESQAKIDAALAGKQVQQ